MATGLLYDKLFLNHNTGAGHPECAARLSETITYCQRQPWFNDLKSFRSNRGDERWVAENHGLEYLKRAQAVCASGETMLDSADVSVCSDSYNIALNAVGGVITLADAMMQKDVDNGFALIRPPGHHAERELALGFCLLNNIAILARYLQKQHGLDKILILDWDVHHGNGTQHSFQEDPSVLYISLHQYPHYPGTGAYSETGTGKGKGATLNCPMSAYADDQDYQRAFQEKILPAIGCFKPDAVLISAGFDAHKSDPLGSVNLSMDGFSWMTKRMLEVADQYAQGRILSLLEGGYNLQYLPLCIAEHLQALLEVRG